MSAAVATKKTTTAKASKPAATKKAPTTTAGVLPPYKDLIKECIVDAGGRDGVSRSVIKKYVEDKYKLSVTPTITSHINSAIAKGAEKGEFVMPKG